MAEVEHLVVVRLDLKDTVDDRLSLGRIEWPARAAAAGKS
jgi:hypothetical protein